MKNPQIEINVEARHIFRGSRECPEGCPIALAIAPFWPGARVSTNSIKLPWGDIMIELPEIAQQFILQFDHGAGAKLKRVKPFKFKVRIPSADYGKGNLKELGFAL